MVDEPGSVVRLDGIRCPHKIYEMIARGVNVLKNLKSEQSDVESGTRTATACVRCRAAPRFAISYRYRP